MSDTNVYWLDEDSLQNLGGIPYNCEELKGLILEETKPISFDKLASLLGLNYKSMAAMLVSYTLAEALVKSAIQTTLEQLISDPSSLEWTNVGTPIHAIISNHGIDLVMMAINSKGSMVYVIIYSRPISFG